MIGVARDWVLFLELFKSRLDFLRVQGLLQTRSQKNFVKELLVALTRRFSPRRHWLYSKQHLIEIILENLKKSLELSSSEETRVKRIIVFDYDRIFHPDRARSPEIEYRAEKLPGLFPETMAPVFLYGPDFLSDRLRDPKKAVFASELLKEMEAIRKIEPLFDALSHLPNQMRKEFRPKRL